jgi:hypothetical protein
MLLAYTRLGKAFVYREWRRSNEFKKTLLSNRVVFVRSPAPRPRCSRKKLMFPVRRRFRISTDDFLIPHADVDLETTTLSTAGRRDAQGARAVVPIVATGS